MSTTGESENLLRQLQEEFLLCKICMEPYKTPKSLHCLHTFCEICIENHIASEATYKKYSDYRDFHCPLCRKRTQLPIGGAKKLPDNFLISNLTDTVAAAADREKGGAAGGEGQECDICRCVAKKSQQAVSRCLDCAKFLCRSCVERHQATRVTRDHAIFDVETEKDVGCHEHPGEVVRFFCEPCQTCVCIICTFNEHNSHEVSNFGDAVLKHRDSIRVALDNCKERVAEYEKCVRRVCGTEQQISEAEQKIREVALEFISEIRQREKHLVEELRNLYGKQTMQAIGRKAEFLDALETLKSTCALADIVLRGKDIELLLLKKDVQDKLESLTRLLLVELPKTVSKEIRFLPGHAELGCIVDMDRPNASRQRQCNFSQASFSSLMSGDLLTPDDQATTETQTDPADWAQDSTTPMNNPVTQPNTSDTQCQTVDVGRRDVEAATEMPTTEEKGTNTSRSARQDGAGDGESGHRRRRRQQQEPMQQQQQQQQQQQPQYQRQSDGAAFYGYQPVSHQQQQQQQQQQHADFTFSAENFGRWQHQAGSDL